MVRILTCHHFGGQKIGRCEEALQLAVADDLIIVALEHQVAVYSSEFPDSSSSSGPGTRSKLGQGATRDGGDIGSSPIFFMKKSVGDPTPSSSVHGLKGGSELVLSHSFPTVDLIDSISYNSRGNYLLCVEKRDSSGPDSKKILRNVRVYFNWDTSKEGKPMRARIAGLVSPTGADPDDDTLVMVEIPTTSPTGASPPPNIVAAASCNILGHLATLTDSNIINIYAYKLKEVKGRASKSQYSDFDLSYAIEICNFTPDSARIEFLADIMSVSNRTQVNVFRLTKQIRSRSRTASNESGGSLASSGRKSGMSGGGSVGMVSSGPASLPIFPTASKIDEGCDKVVFDPKNESVKVHMNLITRTNHKARFPDAGSGIYEEYQDMISDKTRVIFAANAPALSVQDLLRVHVDSGNSASIVQVGLYPIKIKDDLGGISCVIGMSSQAFVYHIPAKLDCNVVRVVTYPLTAPLVYFAFDTLFFHALTETGLETYTSRSLYYPLKEFEGFQRHKNDCPFVDETPSLVGIRPFMGVRYMAANEFLLCLLASPSAKTHSNAASPALIEESLWTIYALQLPSIELLVEDLSKSSKAAKEGNMDTFVTLTTELHLVLRTYMNMYPESEPHFQKKYKKTCKTIGIEYIKKATVKFDEAVLLSEGSDKYKLENQAEEALDKGVTFLMMSGVDLKLIFEEEPNLFLKDHFMIRGVTRFVSVVLKNIDSQPLSPKLIAAVTDFLVTHSPETLVQLVIEVPLLRETNSAKLIQITRKLAETSGYKKQEVIALLLTIVTAGGCDAITRNSVKEVLHKCKAKDLESAFQLKWLLDFKIPTKTKLTDLAICLSTARPSIPAAVIVQNLDKYKVTTGQILMAFSQGVNLNSDVEVQHSLTQTLTTIIEKYFADKLKSISNKPKVNQNIVESKANYENEVISKLGTKLQQTASFDLTEDETHAVNTLVRSYVSRITLKPQQVTGQRRNSGGQEPQQQTAATSPMTKRKAEIGHPETTNRATTSAVAHAPTGAIRGSPVHEKKEGTSEEAKKAPQNVAKVTFTEAKVTPFGKIPNFIVHIVKDTHTYVNSNSTAFQVSTLLPGYTEETKEYFLKLGSLLSSPLGNAAGVRDIVANFLETKGQPGSALHVCLEMLAVPYDKAVEALISKYPLALMYFAKDTFGRSTVKWKFLVTKLKEKIYDNREDSEVFATIIEGVYLHVANTLSPTELEEVLDKGEENSRFFKACRRTELANSYNQMIVQMSNEYL